MLGEDWHGNGRERMKLGQSGCLGAKQQVHSRISVFPSREEKRAGPIVSSSGTGARHRKAQKDG